MTLSRRRFLQASGAAAAVAAIPTVWTRRARAATPAFGAARHVLVLFARGGLRSHCLWNAVGTAQHNPFGTQPAAPGTEWTLGAGCGTEDLATTAFGVLPGFHAISHEVAVVACVDHNPGGAPNVDHEPASVEIGTGSKDGPIGLLARVGRHHARFANGFSAAAVPPVEIGATPFGYGAGDYAEARPLSLAGADAAFAAGVPVGKGWAIPARASLSERFRDRRSRAFRARLGAFVRAQASTVVLADVLQDPRLDVRGRPDAADAGVTNAQLLDVLGDYSTAAIGDYEDTPSWGPDVALALRCFAFGVPAAVVTRDTYDMHDNEKRGFRPRTQDLVRQLAGLSYLLKAMPHPEGGVYWDHTVVTVISEFSRNNTDAATGFNSGNGSDHVAEGAGPTRNQAVPFMGGPIAAAGRRIGATDDQMNAIGPVYSSRSWQATLLDLLGVDPGRFWSDAPIQELYP